LELGRNASTTAQRLNLLKKMMQGELKSEPGRKFLYSNAGYALAGLMAEQVTGEAWEKLMRERLFGPLGMASAGFGAPGTPGKVDQPWGHVVKPDGPEGRQADNAPGAGPAGRVHCTMTDWAKFVNLHLHAARGDARMLKAETSTHLHTPSPGTDYACGWIITKRPWADGTVLTHNGSNTMWYAVVWIAPKKDLAVLVVANQGDKEAEKACDDTAGALIGHQLK
jgi:CubicO group peptidase (beta-lactamase class C family)